MERFYQLYHFYKKPLLIVSILNLIFSVVFTTHFEEYEGIFSSFVQGIYTTPSIKEWNVDVHLFLCVYKSVFSNHTSIWYYFAHL